MQAAAALPAEKRADFLAQADPDLRAVFPAISEDRAKTPRRDW